MGQTMVVPLILSFLLAFVSVSAGRLYVLLFDEQEHQIIHKRKWLKIIQGSLLFCLLEATNGKFNLKTMGRMVSEMLIAASLFSYYLASGWGIPLLIYTLFTMLFTIAILTDIRHHLIPDGPTAIVALVMTVVVWVFSGGEVYDHLLGMLGAAGLMLLILLASKFKGMGGADVKLFILIGWVFGLKGFLIVFLLSVYIGLAFGLVYRFLYRKNQFPFGPAIGLATLSYLWWQDSLLHLLAFYF